ncbi:Actin-like protein arp6 [Penicillium subrubescens]|uniref:Actin-like protein arp6 n=1 Tax=Penicillium subrubescens TaxID=1316194 RepID=A0A1Q5TG28_9EURO|nr:Actin-like protein arp6 [Penicillium subrubescens]KAJ5890714.1 Actin-like protein arp6 [Penicillium subrubescens]OKO99135.1 Actin-like protein arp6 [Penicillium subrubescens]
MVTKSRTSTKAAKNSPDVPARHIPNKTFVIDNGAYTMKAGYACDPSSSPEEALSNCISIPNAIVKTRDNRIWTGTQIASHVTDWNEAVFRRPVEKGYIVNWEAEREIWDQTFFEEKATARNKQLRIAHPEETTLVLTEAPNNLPVLQRNTDEMVMEEWGFGGYVRCLGPTLNAWNEVQSLFGDPLNKTDSDIMPKDCLLVVDSGYSHTTVTPVYKGQPIQRAIRRLDVGGKLLTNYLKEIVSMRQYNMVDETYIMNEVKEAVCFVSNDFKSDMERTWKANRKREEAQSVVVDYVLPDPNAHKTGFMRPHDPLLHAKKKKGALSGLSAEVLSEDVLVLGNERFTVPELLFTPSDIGMQQAGIPDMILQSLSVLPPGLHAAFLANVLVVGGNSCIPGFMERLENDLRGIASSECVVRVRRAEDPFRFTWLGGSRLASNREELGKLAITRQEYQEYGSGWAGRRFAGMI